MNTLADWLNYLENSQQQEIQLGLDRISQVARRLDLLNFDAKIITVAGTNGKGSTVAALEAIYSAAGYQVASYTSPHLMTFNERIRVNQQLITDEDLCTAFSKIEQRREGIHLTYFEMTTLAAFWYFKQCKPEVIILEVGMGGRLDATNIVDTDLAIITTIDLDHQDYLGATREAIGYEKAGILRAGKPFIYADVNPPTSIIEQAALLGAERYFLDVDFSFKATTEKLQLIQASGKLVEVPLPRLNPKAAVAAIIATTCLQDELPVSVEQCAEAMRAVFIHGRQQIKEDSITTLFDVAHNPQAVSLLAEFIQRRPIKGNVHAVFSALKDKDLCGLIKPMRACVDFWYPAILEGKRASSESLLLTAFHSEDCSISACFDSPRVAYQAAMEQANPGDLIVVYGSFLMVSAVMVPKELQ